MGPWWFTVMEEWGKATARGAAFYAIVCTKVENNFLSVKKIMHREMNFLSQLSNLLIIKEFQDAGRGRKNRRTVQSFAH
jgi:uncharacterized protein YwgA